MRPEMKRTKSDKPIPIRGDESISPQPNSVKKPKYSIQPLLIRNSTLSKLGSKRMKIKTRIQSPHFLASKLINQQEVPE